MRGMNTRKFIILLVEAIAVIAACVTVVIINQDRMSSFINSLKSPSTGGVELVLDPNQTSQRSVKVSDKSVAIPGWQYITVKEGANEATVDLYNPLENTDYYNLSFALYLTFTPYRELLYQSKLVSPGNHIYSIQLNRSFSKGEYDAVIHIQPYRISDNTSTNNSDINIKLIVV